MTKLHFSEQVVLINKVFQLSEIPFFLHLNEVNANVAPIKIEMQKYESNLKCLGLFFFFSFMVWCSGFSLHLHY